LARRTFGAFALNAGIPLAEVSKMLGHESLETTRKAYAPILPTLVGESWYAVFGGVGEAPARNVYRDAMRELAEVLVARAAKISGPTLAERAAVAKAAKDREPWMMAPGEADWLNP
jgi:Arc/MetJ family transcription regulator